MSSPLPALATVAPAPQATLRRAPVVGDVNDQRQLRNALGSFTTGVTIVTTVAADGSDVGLTANSFSSVSLQPPLVLWSLSRQASSLAAFREQPHFAVHVLAAEQQGLSNRFASKGADRFAGLVLSRGAGGVPLLHDCLARFECKLVHQVEGGDHIIFVGEVLSYNHDPRQPLVFQGGRYGQWLPVPPGETRGPDEALGNLSQDDLLFLVSNAYFATRSAVVSVLESLGWTPADYAVLSIVGRENGLRVQDVLRLSQALRGQAVAAEAVWRLVDLGLVQAHAEAGGEPTLCLSPAGRQAVVELMALRKAGEAQVRSRLAPQELQALQQLLARLGGPEAGV